MTELFENTLETSGMDVSATKIAPFHRPVMDEEIRRYLLRPDAPPPVNGELEIGEGWALSVFGLSTKDGRTAAWGWVKGAFAIDERRAGSDCFYATLNHLPTGFAMINAYDAESAGAIADLLAPICDWANADVDFGKTQVLNVRNTLIRAGYETVNAVSDDLQKVRLWVRRAI
ncbi:hypothetical protein M2322_000812 [Rhodoblastus acidophilus]|uniref:hypothetical protein n=1 Tax=Rhodoblastus acidophilus TaxID=1074 RepID=UPI00222437F5|nr:hypothetical protein [Rhodoblastus acidophilus]MCW2315278.1 hypothetical protein [Rhodoblastus acidophilus]